MYIIRPIKPEETDLYCAIRAEALSHNAETFGGTLEEFVETPYFKGDKQLEITDHNYILGAFERRTGTLVGMVGFRRESRIKMQHKSFIWGMYVTPEHRRKGLGRKLVDEVLQRAKRLEGLEQVRLFVVTINKEARLLYLSLGFLVYGYEKNALSYKGKRYDEEYMVYWLHTGDTVADSN